METWLGGYAVWLRLLLADGAGRDAAVEVTVHGPAGSLWKDAWPGVAAVLARPVLPPADVYVDDVRLDGDTLVGWPPLVDGAVLRVGGSRRSARASPALLRLHAVAGPCSGTVIPLGSGRHRIGRAAEAGIRLADTDVSRVHAQLTVSTTGVTVADLGSSNGTWVGGRRLDVHEADLTPGDEVGIGRTTLVLRTTDATPAATRPDGAGRLIVNLPPRTRLPSSPPAHVQMPREPERRQGPRLPLTALLLPLVLAAFLAVVQDSLVYLALGLMSPLMLLGSWAGERRHHRRGDQSGGAAYHAQLDAAHRRVAAALAQERRERLDSAPDLAFLSEACRAPSSRLWERQPTDADWLVVRLGTGALPASTVVMDGDGTARSTTLADVPVTLSMNEIHMVGVAGPRSSCLSLARSLIGQLAGWHSPQNLEIEVLAAGPVEAAAWRWVTYLPHAQGAQPEDGLPLHGSRVSRRLAEVLSALDGRPASAGVGPASSLIVLDGALELRTLPGMPRLLADGGAAGLRFLCIAERVGDLPTECGATIHADSNNDVQLRQHNSSHAQVIAADLADETWAEGLARALAPLRPGSTGETGGLPDSVRLLDLLPFDATDPSAIAANWRGQPSSSRAVLGRGRSGPFAVDLVVDGPHVLVGGTTGSGKSELLQTLIAALAVVNRPDQMGFVLIDYKGGAAFSSLSGLPHTLGLVTDLDVALSRRALESLHAELKRREGLLREAGATDLEDFQRRAAQHGSTPIPRLVIVADEFRMLAQELPAFVSGLVSVATVGRSLGVHLVLATQRPAGVVTPDLKANVNLRIALRMRDDADSMDVIDRRDAAGLSHRLPGRAYVSVGGGPLELIQSARVLSHAPGPAEGVVRVLPTRGSGSATSEAPSPSGPTDLLRVIQAAAEAAVQCGVLPVASPWLPPLPPVITLAELPEPERPRSPDDRGQCAEAALTVPYGLVDLPQQQAQRALTFDLSDGEQLGIGGGPRSGRTTALLTIADSVARRLSPDNVHVYGLEGSSGSLRPLLGLPHTGTVVSRDEPGRTRRLVARLLEELTRRQGTFATGGWRSLSQQRAGSADPLPCALVLVDGWDALTAALDKDDHGRTTEDLLRLLREGPAVGIRAVVSGDRSVLLSRVSSCLPSRLVLPMSDPADAMMAGVPTDAVPSKRQPPGRAVRVGDGAEVQIVIPAAAGAHPIATHGSLSVDGAARLDGRHGTLTLGRSGGTRATRVERLPTSVRAADISHEPSYAWALLGVGGDDLGPVGFAAGAAGGGAVLVVGPSGSGRSTALATMALSLARGGRRVGVITARPSPLSQAAGRHGIVGLPGHDVDALHRLCAAHPDLVAVVDDAGLLADTATDALLVSMLRASGATGAAVICSAGTAELAGSFRGVAVETARRRVGVVLNPLTGLDGDVLGIRAGPVDARVPGRGLLVAAGAVTEVQVALPG